MPEDSLLIGGDIYRGEKVQPCFPADGGEDVQEGHFKLSLGQREASGCDKGQQQDEHDRGKIFSHKVPSFPRIIERRASRRLPFSGAAE